jgi:hypothetical protein
MVTVMSNTCQTRAVVPAAKTVATTKTFRFTNVDFADMDVL